MKKTIKISESKLRNMIKKSAMKMLKESEYDDYNQDDENIPDDEYYRDENDSIFLHNNKDENLHDEINNNRSGEIINYGPVTITYQDSGKTGYYAQIPDKPDYYLYSENDSYLIKNYIDTCEKTNYKYVDNDFEDFGEDNLDGRKVLNLDTYNE